MNSRKSAKAIPSTLNRFLKSRALLKSPPPAFYPLAAHPPPPSLVRSFPTRDPLDLAPDSPTRDVALARASSRAALNLGTRLSPVAAAAAPVTRTTTTRRKPPQPFNPKHARPERIVFPEDRIRARFYRDHPFEAYRPVDLVELDKVQSRAGPTGAAWAELRQTSLNPSPEDCIAFIENLTSSHGVALATAYPLGIAQYRTLRAEFETASRAARLQAEAHGAVFFGEIERAVAVEENVLDEWVNAKDVAERFAVQGGGRGGAQGVAPSATAAGEWTPVEGRPAQLGGGATDEGQAEFTGGVEYLRQFDATS
ncbi:hypothetical protein JCM11491_006041 [Sporobolomyces phaffii]